MNKEFHYDMTYVILMRAGADQEFARLAACSAQFIDERLEDLKFHGITLEATQTPILAPRTDRRRIFPVFHFIPGEPGRASPRKDRLQHEFVTTPDSPLARKLLTCALESRDPYRLGIALHAYADTWAHQNFVGCRHSFNAFPGIINGIIPNIGHHDAGHKPDQLGYWNDLRLENEMIDNRRRFRCAAIRMYEECALFFEKAQPSTVILIREKERFRGMLDAPTRKERQALREGSVPFGYPHYSKDAWFDDALEAAGPDDFKDTSLYLFHEAAKAHIKDFKREAPVASSWFFEDEEDEDEDEDDWV